MTELEKLIAERDEAKAALQHRWECQQLLERIVQALRSDLATMTAERDAARALNASQAECPPTCGVRKRAAPSPVGEAREPHHDDTEGGPGACADEDCRHSPLRHDMTGCLVDGCPCCEYAAPGTDAGT